MKNKKALDTRPEVRSKLSQAEWEKVIAQLLRERMKEKAVYTNEEARAMTKAHIRQVASRRKTGGNG